MNGCFNMIGGGVRAKTKVIAVASKDALPETARTGTIAIISDIPVGDVYVSLNEPEQYKRGDVNIIPSGSQKNWAYVIGNAIIPFVYVGQWNGSEWIWLETYQYNGSEWGTDTFYLLDGAVEGVDWQVVNYASANVQKTSYGYIINGANYGNQPAAIQTAYTVDLSGYSKLHCYGVNDNEAENYYPFTFGIQSKRLSNDPTVVFNQSIAKQSYYDAGGFELVVDVTNYQGGYYVGCAGAHESTHVYAIWLEV